MARTKNTGDVHGAQVKVSEGTRSNVAAASKGKMKPGEPSTTVKKKTRLSEKESVADDTPMSKKSSRTVSDTSRTKVRIETNEVKNQSTGGHASKRKRSTIEGIEEIKNNKARKAEVKEVDVRETPYRSSLGGIMTVIKGLNLRECHKKVLRLTPFWAIFEAIIDNQLSSSQCRKSDKMIMEIIDTFDPDEEKFRVGKRKQMLDITREDIVRFFGIQCGDEFVSLQYGCKEAVRFVMRRGIVDKKLTTTLLKQLLDKYVVGDEKDDVEDVARLLCLYLLHTFLFPMGLNVKWVLCERVDDLERLQRYDWNGAIIKELMSSVKKYHKEPRKVSGCVMALLYWLCDHTTLTTPLHPEHPLGIVRWSIPALVSKFKKVWIKDLKRSQVIMEVAGVARTSVEDEPEEKHVVHDTLPQGDVNKSSESNARHSDDALICTETMPSGSYSSGNVEGFVHDPAGHMDRTPVGCSISGLQMQDEVRFQSYKDSPAPDDNASTIKELRAQIELKDAEIATLKQQIAEKDAMHKTEIEVKDAELVVLNDKILSLIAEGSELWEEYAETITHAATQQVPKDTTKQQRSLVRNVKAAKRKSTEKEEYLYQLHPKRQKGVPGETDGEGNKEMVDVDTYKPVPKKPGSKLVPIKGIQTNKVLRFLTSEDKNKIDQIWNEATNSTNIWCGSIHQCSVFAEDLRCLITENAISGNVIDAYSEYLLMEQELKKKEISNDGSKGLFTQEGTNLTSYTFTSSFLSLIAGKTNDERIGTFEKIMPKTSQYRYLLFPIHHLFHWTLLVLDNEEGTWKFYNSMRPRKGMMDANLEAARLLKIQIDGYYKFKNGLLSTQECQDVCQVQDSPQQSPGSLDCGVIVCYIIRQYFRNEEVATKFPKTECRRMRADILHSFLSDELHFWSSQQQKVDEEE